MYCIDFFRKFKKDGNFCGLDKSEVSRLNAYLDVVELLMKQKIPEETVYTHLSVKAARPLLSAKGEERTEALNYVTSQLKEGKKISGTDLQSTMKSWTCPTSEPVVKPVQKKGPEPAKEEKPQKKPGYVGCYQPGEIKTTNDPPQPSLAQQQANKGAAAEPAPAKPLIPACTRGGTCPKMKTDGIRGQVCDMLGVPVNQLPASGCPFDSAKGFTPASRLDAAKPLVERPAYKIVPVQLSKQEAEAAIKSVVRGYLTKAQQGIWGDIRKSGECGDTDLEIFEAMIDRMGAA